MRSELYDEIVSALRSLGIDDFLVEGGADVIENIRNEFIVGNPSVWWHRFKYKYIAFYYEDQRAFLRIAEISPYQDCKVWFIANDVYDKQLIFDININILPEIIGECRCFEYYIVPHDYRWIMAESDHNVLYFSTKTDLVPGDGPRFENSRKQQPRQ